MHSSTESFLWHLLLKYFLWPNNLGFASFIFFLFFWFAFFFFFFFFFLESTICPLYTWQCNNGECIKFEELCDGNYDCADKSDETVDECLLRPCPSYAFQCAYGACITGNFKCDGIVNCVDGSDETRFLCTPKINYEEEMQGRCM